MLAILAIALIVAAVWGVVFFRQVGLLGGCLGVLLVGSCFGHPFYHVSFGPVPVTADRLLLGGMLAVYLFYRTLGRFERRPLDRLDFVLLIFIGVLAFSTFSHDWHAHGSRALASLLFFYLLPCVLYWIVREAPFNARALVAVLASLAAFGLYLAVTSVLEQQQVWSFVFPRYIVTDTAAEFLGRGRGPYLNPVGNGMFLCAGLFSLWMFWPRVSRHGKALLLVATVVYLAGIYCTLTRVVWLAAGAGLLVILVTHLPRRWGIACVAVTALLGIGLVTARWSDLNAFKRDRNVSVAEMSQSASLRPILAYIAWQMYLDQPLTGCGYRQYESVSDLYLADRVTSLNLERGRSYVQHNVFLALLAETGTIGLGMFLLLMAVLIRAAWLLWRAHDADLATRQIGLLMLLTIFSYVIMGMFHDLTLIPMIHMLMFFLAGVTRGLQPQRAWHIAAVHNSLQRNPPACTANG